MTASTQQRRDKGTRTEFALSQYETANDRDGVRERSIYPNLKLRIYATGMRQNRLAELVGIDEANLSRIVNGIRIPGQQLRLQIAQVLQCNVEWLFKRTIVKSTSNMTRENASLIEDGSPQSE